MRQYKVKPINALARGLEVLQALRDMRAATLHDLHLQTGFPKASLTRILYTLHRQGLVWQRIIDGAYLPSHAMHPRTQLDDTAWLVEIASPVLEQLCEKVKWPATLSVPRLDHVEVIETNAPRAYFDDIRLGPIGFRVNLLLAASGRAYLCFCPDQEREAVLRRLRDKDQPGHRKAWDDAWIRRVVATTRKRGYSTRDPDFGGDYDLPRREADDGRNSIAMPIMVNQQVIGCINMSWRTRAVSMKHMIEHHLDDLHNAVNTVARRASRVINGEMAGAN
jgi:IclR family mhp operon transcriptional activator